MSRAKNTPPAARGTTIRAVRIDDELWALAGEVCEQMGTDRATVMREALARYVKRHTA